MFRTLSRLFRRAVDSAQLELVLPDAAPRRMGVAPSAPADADALLATLTRLGLKRITRARLTHNRNVMVSFGAGELRVHEGYVHAPESVLRAIVIFVQGRTRAERRAAERVIVTHPIVGSSAPTRREGTHAADHDIAQQLLTWHERYNTRHFGGRLTPIKLRVSRRMKSRLGHYTVSVPGGDAAEIAISRAHIKRHGWTEVLHTLLHEMVHQWQDETGCLIDHGTGFRAKAREVGIAPYARRALTRVTRTPP